MNRDVYTVLAEYSRTDGDGGPARLKEWIHRYPEYEQALVEFALYDHVFENSASSGDNPAEEARLKTRIRDMAKRMMQEQGVVPIASLLDEAKQRGIAPAALARELDLGLPEIAKLDRRLFDAATLPKRLVSRLAAALDRTYESVAAYLCMPPTLSAQASYRSAVAPRIVAQEDFAVAIQASATISDEQKSRWQAEATHTLAEKV